MLSCLQTMLGLLGTGDAELLRVLGRRTSCGSKERADRGDRGGRTRVFVSGIR